MSNAHQQSGTSDQEFIEAVTLATIAAESPRITALVAAPSRWARFKSWLSSLFARPVAG